MAMEKQRVTTPSGETIVRRAIDANAGAQATQHPTVLSCGGIFVPRPRPLNPRDPLYHILNTPMTERPAKVVSALVHRNILQEVLTKETLN